MAASPAQKIPPKKVVPEKPMVIAESDPTQSLFAPAKRKAGKSTMDFSMKGLVAKRPTPKTRTAKLKTPQPLTATKKTEVANKSAEPAKTRIVRKPSPTKPNTPSTVSTKIVGKAPKSSPKVVKMKVSDKPESTLKFSKDGKRKPIRVSAIPTGDSTTLRFR